MLCSNFHIYHRFLKDKKIKTFPYLPTLKLKNKSETDLFFPRPKHNQCLNKDLVDPAPHNINLILTTRKDKSRRRLDSNVVLSLILLSCPCTGCKNQGCCAPLIHPPDSLKMLPRRTGFICEATNKRRGVCFLYGFIGTSDSQSNQLVYDHNTD